MGIAEYQSFLFIDYRNLIFGMLDLPYHYKYMAFNFLRGWKNKAGLPFLKKYWKINRISLYRESLKQNYCFNFDSYLHLFKSFFFSNLPRLLISRKLIQSAMRAFIIKFEFTSLLCSGVRIPSLGKKNKCKLISSVQCSKNEKIVQLFKKTFHHSCLKNKIKILLIQPIFEAHQPMRTCR